MKQALVALNVVPDDQFSPPQPAITFRTLNKALFETANATPQDLAGITPHLFQDRGFDKLRHDAFHLVDTALKANLTIGLFDPGAVLLLPFWQRIFERVHVPVHYVISVRNPLATAYSLNQDQSFPLQKGVLLWARYMVEAIGRTDGERRIFSSFDRLLSVPEQEVERLSLGLDLSTGNETEPSVEIITDIDPTRRHHHNSAVELSQSRLAPPLVVSLYEQVLRLAASDPLAQTKIDPDQWTLITNWLAQSTPIFQYTDDAHNTITNLETGLKIAHQKTAAESRQRFAITREYHHLSLKAEALELEATQSKAALASAQNQIRFMQNALKEEQSAHQQTRQSLEALHQSNAAEIGILTDAKLVAEEKSQKLESNLAEFQTEQQAKRAHEEEQRKALNAALDAANAEKQEIIADREQLRFALTQKKLEFTTLQTEKSGLDSAMARTKESLASLAAALDKAKAQLDESRQVSEQRNRSLQTALRENRETQTILETEREHNKRLKTQLNHAKNHAHKVGEINRSLTDAQEELRREHHSLRQETDGLHASFEASQAEIETIKRSTSWRLTAPIRAFGNFFVGKGKQTNSPEPSENQTEET